MSEGSIIQKAVPFESVTELRYQHIGLLKRLERQLAQDASEENQSAALSELEPEIRRFLERGAATGAYLDQVKERTASQVLLDYWVSSLTRAGKPVSAPLLAEFDSEQLPILNDDDCPYVGLKAFTNETYFYGREANTRELVENVRNCPLVVVHGASGTGKSSLVMGGALPVLKAKGATPELRILPIFTPGNAVLDNLVRAVLQVCQSTCGSVPEEVIRLRQDPMHLCTLVGGESAPPTLIAIDQFEEVFTLSVPADREALAANLVEFLKANRGHRIILTVREEFKDRIVELRALSPYLVDKPAFYSMRAMTYEELKSAIEKPAGRVNLQFQSGIVDELVRKVLGQDAALPLLQFTLRSLWKKRNRNRITWEVYNAIGDPLKSLEKSADDFFEGQIPETQAEIKRILLELVRVNEMLEAYRQPVLKSSLLGAGQANTEEVLKLLAKKDYVHITSGTSDANTVLEVKHESLIRNWPKFVSWIDEKRRKIRERIALTQAAKRWAEKGKQQKGLLTRSQLEDVRGEPDLSELEKEFIQASEEAAARRQQEREAALQRQLEERTQANEKLKVANEKLKDRVWAVVILVVLVLCAVFYALQCLRKSEKETRIANAIRLATQSQITLENYPQRSLLLAVEAVETTVREREPDVLAAETALRQALSGAGGLPFSGHEDLVSAVAISPDNRWLATGSWDKTARLWDLTAKDPAAKPKVLSGHDGSITAVAFSRNSRWLVTGSSDKTARLWDLTASDPAAASILLPGHEDRVTALAISRNNRWLVTGSWDKTARLWDLTASDPVTASIPLRGHTDIITAAAISRNNRWVVTGSADTTVCLWDLAARDPAAEHIVLSGHKDGITAVAISRDSHWLVTGSWDKTACLWDLTAKDPAAEPKVLGGHRGHREGITAVAISPDNRWLVTGSSDKTARLWDLTAKDPAAASIRLHGHEDGISTVAISPDNRWLVTGSWDKTARVWDLKEPAARRRVLRGHEGGLNAVAISSDSRWLVTGSLDKTARLWDLTAKDPIVEPRVLRGHEGDVNAVAISPDNRWLVTGSSDKTARLWDLTAKDPIVEPRVLRGHEGDVNAVAISPDNRWLVTGSSDKTARLWDLTAKDPAAKPKVLSGHEGRVNAVAISSDSRWLVTGSLDKTARLWDLTAKDPIVEPRVLRGHEWEVTAVAISRDSRWLVTGSTDSTACLWGLTAKGVEAKPRVLRGHERGVYAVAISPDSHWLVTGSSDKTARLWDLTTGDPAAQPIVLQGHEDKITAVAFSPNNRWLVTGTGSSDKTARLWDLIASDPAAQPIVLQGHEDEITAMAFSPNNRWLVTGSLDKTARLWDLAARDPAALPVILRGHEEGVTAVAISPNNRWLVTSSLDKTARRWNLRLNELIDLACRTAARNLAKEEWNQYMGGHEYRKTCSDPADIETKNAE